MSEEDNNNVYLISFVVSDNNHEYSKEDFKRDIQMRHGTVSPPEILDNYMREVKWKREL